MRLLFILIGLVLPLASMGQSLRLFAVGGIMINTTTIHSVAPNEEIAYPSGGIGQIGVGYKKKGKWEYGVSASYRRYAVRHESMLVFEEGFDPLTGYSKTTYYPVDALEKLPCLAATPFINRHFTNGRTEIYAGLHAGYAHILEQNVEKSTGYSAVGKREVGGGATGGLQGGCAIKVWKALAIRTELSLDWLWTNSFSLGAANLTTGLQYTLH